MNDFIKIACVGDIMLGDHPIRLGHGVRSAIEEKGIKHLFLESESLMKGCDIVFGNLEVVISDEGLDIQRIESREFRGAPESAAELKRSGFTVLNIANNHCMQHGRKAFFDTVKALEQIGIFVAGVKGDHGRCIPYEIEKNGQRVTFLAYSQRPENYEKNQLLPYCLSKENEIIEDVEHYGGFADAVIVSIHWGEEFMRYPSPKQVKLGRKMIDAGAKLVIGHHPHTIQGVEKYKGGVIVYSLGNFVFDMWQRATRKTIILSATLSKGHAPIFKIYPFLIGRGFCPQRLEGIQAEHMKGEFQELSHFIYNKYYGIEKLGDDEVEKKERDYQRMAKSAYLRHRIENYLYFLVHLYRYESPVILQSLRRSFMRRLQEFGHRSGL